MNDAAVAKAYLAKIKYCKDGNKEFSLTFSQYKRLWNAKRCYYTGTTFPDRGHDWTELEARNRPTIDRVDNTKGYVVGNVVACTYDFNQLKSLWENPASSLTEAGVRTGLSKLKRRK